MMPIIKRMFDKSYDPKEIEPRIYETWEKSGFFNPDNLPLKKRSIFQKEKYFSIIMPPPNANGALHVGHAVGTTLQDIMIRFSRMKGLKTLWLPGADHAGFETQVVFDKKLDKEGRNRFSMDREVVWKEMYEFTQTNKTMMENQLRKLGASTDWSREKFTLAPEITEEVKKTFVALYKDGFAYRDLRVVNWCPKHKTALAELEIKYIEKTDPLYYIKYGPLTLATVRPETKFGDTALAVNPKDRRYKDYVGKTIDAEGILGPLKLKVIADNAIDPAFGTGVVKVTPAHDTTDFEIWTRHKNEIDGPKVIIDESGRLTGDVGEFKGLKVAEARPKVVEAMKAKGILEKVDPNYTHQVATCYKCNSILEPLPKPQWYISMKPLAKKAIKVVRKGEIKFFPDRSKKVYFHWLENIKDWNISHQIVWGIRIPAWFRNEEIYVGLEAPKGDGWEQDPDVFSTWFSSGQWPFLTLGYPKGKDLKKFYPTDVLETGYDILFFWVARMIMFGLYRTGKVPFKNVYLHGLVRDKDRQKMSKSKGNTIDPLGVAETYGTDALRMALVVGNTPGNDIVISEDKIRGYRNFATKIWNISKFVLMNKKENSEKPVLSKEDRDNIRELGNIKRGVTKHLEKFEFHLAAEKIYHYVWHTFADKIIEASKPRLKGENQIDAYVAYTTLHTILKESLKMLHPFMPFITEAIWKNVADEKEGLLMITKW